MKYTDYIETPLKIEGSFITSKSGEVLYAISPDLDNEEEILKIINSEIRQMDDVACYSDDGIIMLEIDGAFEPILVRVEDELFNSMPTSVYVSMERSIVGKLNNSRND